MANIEKVISTLYRFNFDSCTLGDGDEFIIQNGESEFVNTFRLYDINNGIIVTPSGYMNGFVFSNTNGGEIYNNPTWMPDVITFNMNFYGLKKGSIYKIDVIARSTGDNTIITDDRNLIVNLSSGETLIKENLKTVKDNKQFSAIFKASGVEENILFQVGKLFINNIILTEVQLSSTEKEDSEKLEMEPSEIIYNKTGTKGYGIFSFKKQKVNTTRYIPLVKYASSGINLYLDTAPKDPKYQNTYIIERDNSNDSIGESFVNLPYFIDINMNKCILPSNICNYRIIETEATASPLSLLQGYIRFELVDYSGKRITFTDIPGRLYILINKIY